MLTAYFNNNITVINQSEVDSWGTVSGSCTVYPARIERSQKVVRDLKGAFVQASWQIMTDPAVSLNASSLIILGSEPDAITSGEIVSTSQKWAVVDYAIAEGFAPMFARIIL